MGLFGKKKEKKDSGFIAGTNAVYYDGGLAGFSANDGVFVALMDDALTITKKAKKDPLTVSLDKSRILGMDVFNEENDYMLKYHGQKASTHKPSGVLGDMAKKCYFVINYTAKDGTQKRLDFWCSTMESIKVLSLKKKLMNDVVPGNYEI